MHHKFVLSLATLGATFMLSAADDPLADAKWAFHFDRDINCDGIVDTNDLRDVRDRGLFSTNAPYTGHTKGFIASGPYGDKEPCRYMKWNTDGVTPPMRGVTEPVSCLDMCWRTNELGKSATRGFKRSWVAVKGSITVFTRIKAKTFNKYDLLDNNVSAFLVLNGWGGSNKDRDKSGLMLNFTSIWNGQKGQMAVTGGGISYTETSFSLDTNTWYDVCWSLQDNKDGTGEGLFVAATPWGQVYSATNHFDVAFTNAADATKHFSVGGYGGVDKTSLLSASDLHAFNGYMSRFYVWNRALTKDEILRVMVEPRPIFELGIANGLGGEFGLTNETSYTYNVGKQSLLDLPQGLTSTADKSALTLNLPVYDNMEEYVVPYIFDLKAATNFTGNAEIDILVNGVSLGEAKTLAAGESASWYVHASRFTDKEHPTLTIRRTGGTAELFVFDKLSLTGSYGVGIKNAETEMREKTFTHVNYLGLHDASLMAPGPNLWKNAREYAFYVPEDQAEHAFRFASRKLNWKSSGTAYSTLAGLGLPTSNFPFCFKMNDTTIYDAPNGLDQYGYISANIPVGVIKPGWNTLTVAVSDDIWNAVKSVSNWQTSFDYFRLAIRPNPLPGLTVTVR